MVTKDVSRFLVQQRKHYVGARLQQGRVLLDSDFNENVELARENQRRVLVNVIGPAGSPDLGFSIRRPLDIPAGESDRLRPGTIVPTVDFGEHVGDGTVRPVHPVAIRPGTIYTGGLRFDLEEAESLVYQRDYLQLAPANLPDDIGTGQNDRFLYYLRAWEQSVSAVEDQELREAMLKGGDTSVRVRRMRRVEVFDLEETPAVNCDQAWAALRSALESTEGGTFDTKSFELVSAGRLRLEYVGGEAEDACAPCDPFGKRYLGAENQTLRVLLTSATSFVWTLDDPKLFRIRVTGLEEASPDEVKVVMLDPPLDEHDWPFTNRVVEIIPFGALLEGADVPGPPEPHYRKLAAEIGVFTRALETFDRESGEFEIDQGDGGAVLEALRNLVYRWPNEHPDAAKLNASDGGRYFYMRVWHQAPTRDAIELPTASEPVLGTTGIKPHFTPGRRGDYWICALRPEAPKEALPFELLHDDGAPPSGPKRFFAPLAFVEFDGTTVVSVDDCRPRIRPLNNRLCTKYSVGDGVHSFGDFTSIGEAIEALPRTGGTISVGPGLYSESFSISDRNDITIAGCGPSTIIRGDGRPFGSIIEIAGCERITLSSFAVQAVDGGIQIFASGTRTDTPSRNISLVELDVATGDTGGANDEFRPGQGGAGLPQLGFTGVEQLSLQGIVMRPNRQPGLMLQDCNNVAVERLVANGSSDIVSPQAAPPLFELRGCTAVVVRDATLRTFTQPGVSVVASPVASIPCRQLDFSGLDIEAGAVDEATTRLTPVLAPFDVDDDNAIDITLRSSVIRMHRQKSTHAAVSILGQRVTIENNRIEVASDPALGTLAWGGIHLRGRSQGISVRGNRILGGAGHGITLGSVIWRREGKDDRRGTPGDTQLEVQGETGFVSGIVDSAMFQDEGEGFLTYSAVDEGELTDVVIADNTIEGFATNGIAALGVIGIQFDGETGERIVLEVARLRIERNVIRNNVRHPLTSMPINASTLPFSTARAGTADILVGQNLTLAAMPLGGVVLASGQNIEITDNAITDNGLTPGAVSMPVNGIFVLSGDAISIEGNRISNNGRRLEAGDPVLTRGVRAGIGVMLAGIPSTPRNTGAFDDFLFGSTANLDNRGVALRVVNNTVKQSEGRALHVVAAGPVSIDGNFLSSQGNHDAVNRTSQFSVGDVVYVQNLGAPWETFQFQEAFSGVEGVSEYAHEATPLLAHIMQRGNQLPSPRWFTGLGGGILFVNNQVVYDWTVARLPTDSQAPLSFFPNVLLGVDHTTVVGNQFAVRLEGFTAELPSPHPPDPFLSDTAPLYATLLAAGVTTNIELNRFSETILSTFLSLLANGDVMNLTTLNESTHRIASLVTSRTTNMLRVIDNLILVQPFDPIVYSALIDLVKPSLQQFLRLTFRP